MVEKREAEKWYEALEGHVVNYGNAKVLEEREALRIVSKRFIQLTLEEYDEGMITDISWIQGMLDLHQETFNERIHANEIRRKFKQQKERDE